MCNDGSAGCKVHPTTAGYGLIAAYLNTGLASGFKSADGRSTTTFDPSNLGSPNVLSNGNLTVTSSGSGGGTDSRKGF